MIKKALEQIIKRNIKDIEYYVAKEALSQEYADYKDFFKDLQKGGCVSGLTRLIDYNDTHTFYDNHYDEIEGLRIEHEEDFIVGDLKNHFAWFAFEIVAFKLVDKLGVELC